MRTHVVAPETREAAHALTLDHKLALTSLAMDGRLDVAGLTFDVNTATIPVEAPEILTVPAPPAVSRPATAGDVLQEARRLITVHGWIRQYAGRTDTGYCLIGAIRAAAAGNQRLEDEAESLMLDRIRRHFPDALSVGQWNDGQSGPAPVIRMLG